MKKITLFAFAAVALSLASCKKDRTCECTFTSSTGSNSVTTTSTVIKDVKKSEAKTLCQKTTYTDNLNSYTSTSDCKLK